MAEIISQEKIMQTLDWAYEKAINGVPGLGTAADLANDYLKTDGSLEERVNSLILWQNTKCATSGFLTGLGGIITLPVAVPANISSVLYVQIRMIAAIAYMGGYDIRDDKVKTLVYVCLCGSAAAGILKDVGIKIGAKLTEQAIKKISIEIIRSINEAVGFRLITKFGNKGIINLGKLVPVVGALIGATLDALSTNTIGNVAKSIFINMD
jgi:hypothetical protein